MRCLECDAPCLTCDYDVSAYSGSVLRVGVSQLREGLFNVSEGEERWQAVGAEIRAARQARGWNGLRLAQESGITQQRVSQIERAARKASSYEELAALARALDLDLNTLALMALGGDRPAPGASHTRSA